MHACRRLLCAALALGTFTRPISEAADLDCNSWKLEYCDLGDTSLAVAEAVRQGYLTHCKG